MNQEMITREQTETKILPLTAEEIREQVNLIQQVMKSVMEGPTKENPEGVHYGIIPGCKKPTLLKPGAEKLSMTFRLRPVIDNDRDIKVDHYDNSHREITVYCHIMNMAGIELATGIGSCSTMESKYRYRGGEKETTKQPVPTEYWNLKKAGKIDEAQALIGGLGFGVAKFDGKWEICELGEKMENPDIADTYNTVLKMAKKRAYVDGILSATAASDIFTQDMEDFADTAAKIVDTKTTVNSNRAETKDREMPKEKGNEKQNGNGNSSLFITMTAKFDSKCPVCNETIKKGEAILFNTKEKKAYHPACIQPGE